jgi:hypothetical protein
MVENKGPADDFGQHCSGRKHTDVRFYYDDSISNTHVDSVNQ